MGKQRGTDKPRESLYVEVREREWEREGSDGGMLNPSGSLRKRGLVERYAEKAG